MDKFGLNEFRRVGDRNRLVKTYKFISVTVHVFRSLHLQLIFSYLLLKISKIFPAALMNVRFVVNFFRSGMR